jgi:hypothetical protein
MHWPLWHVVPLPHGWHCAPPVPQLALVSALKVTHPVAAQQPLEHDVESQAPQTPA